MGYGDDYMIIEVVLAIISTITTIWQFYLIKHMPINGFMILICSLAAATFMHDIGFFFMFNQDWGEEFCSLFTLGTSCAVGVWTNIMSLTLYRIVHTLESVNIAKEFPYYLIFSMILVLPWGIYSLGAYGATTDYMSFGFRAYYCILFGEIILNFICYASTVIQTNHLYLKVQKQQLSQKQADYITAIVGRMKWYGIAQIFSRIGTIWYYFNSDTSNNSTEAHYLYAILGPICGILYFLVFLHVQPSARIQIIRQAHWGYQHSLQPCLQLCCSTKGMLGKPRGVLSDDMRVDSQDSSRITITQIIPHHINHMNTTGNAGNANATNAATIGATDAGMIDADDLLIIVEEEDKLRKSLYCASPSLAVAVATPANRRTISSASSSTIMSTISFMASPLLSSASDRKKQQQQQQQSHNNAQSFPEDDDGLSDDLEQVRNQLHIQSQQQEQEKKKENVELASLPHHQ